MNASDQVHRQDLLLAMQGTATGCNFTDPTHALVGSMEVSAVIDHPFVIESRNNRDSLSRSVLILDVSSDLQVLVECWPWK
eukprot:3668484-Amphidinium_carterae.1